MRSHWYRNLLRIVVFAGPILLVTYSPIVCAQVPSSEEAQRIIQQKIQTESKGCMKLISFKKTDGIERQIFGAKVYTLEYEAEIEFLQECKWLQDIGPGSPPHAGFSTVKSTAQSQKEGGFWGGYLSQTMQQGTDHKRGEHLKTTGSITFERSERGWRPTNVNVK